MGAPFFNLVNIPLFLALIFLMGVGPLIAWRRASRGEPPAQLPVAGGDRAGRGAALCCALGVGSTLAGAALLAPHGVRGRHHRAGLRAGRRAPAARMGERAGSPPRAGCSLRHNRRYGGFVVHLGILVIAVGVTGSQAWSVQTETTLKRGESVELAGYRIRFDGLRAVEESNHFKVVGTFTVVRPARAACTVLQPGQEVLPAGAVADRLRRLPPGLHRGPLPGAGRLRPRRLARHREGAGQPHGLLDLDRRPRSSRWARAASAESCPTATRQAGRVTRGARALAASRSRSCRCWRCWPTASALNPRDIPSPLVGRPAAPFALTAFDGKPVSLEALRGQIVVVNFWASWCVPACYEEAPVPRARLAAPTATAASSWSAWTSRTRRRPAPKFIAEFRLTFPNAPDPAGKVSVDYGVYGVPETFFIDRAGPDPRQARRRRHRRDHAAARGALLAEPA